MAHPSPTPSPCSEKRRLLLRFTAAIAEYRRLQSKQIRGLLRGEDFPLETEIEEALDRRQRTRHEVMDHRLKHGC